MPEPRDPEMGTPKKRPARPLWEFDPSIPTCDFFEGLSLDDSWGLQEAVENFIYRLEEETFVVWEAVVCEEQGLPLTAEQDQLLSDLLNLGDSDEDRILYVNDAPRTNQPWDVILNRIVPQLLLEPFTTSDVHDDVRLDGWNRLVTALRRHGGALSLPAGAATAEEVLLPDVRHRLWLQYAFDSLSGLGQEDELNLRDQSWRIDEFLACLREHRDSVAHLDLTLASLLSKVILPESDKPRFLAMMREKLGTADEGERLAERL